MQRCFRVYFIQNSAAVGTCTCAICGFDCSCCCQPRRSKRFFRIRVSSLLEMKAEINLELKLFQSWVVSIGRDTCSETHSDLYIKE